MVLASFRLSAVRAPGLSAAAGLGLLSLHGISLRGAAAAGAAGRTFLPGAKTRRSRRSPRLELLNLATPSSSLAGGGSSEPVDLSAAAAPPEPVDLSAFSPPTVELSACWLAQ